MHRSCTPETIMIRQTMEGQPEVGSPKIKVFAMINRIRKNATPQNTDPITDAMTSGIVVNENIPSIAYQNSFPKVHFVSPATRSRFSNSSHFRRKPTHPEMPL